MSGRDGRSGGGRADARAGPRDGDRAGCHAGCHDEPTTVRLAVATAPPVVRPFDLPERNWLPGHRGVDLAAVPGQTVLAAGAGTVVFAGTVAGKPVVSVDHPGGLRTTYEPVEATVSAGRRVERGTVLGTVAPGHPECAAAACLHWGLRRDREYLDPLPLVGAVRMRLLPSGGTDHARG